MMVLELFSDEGDRLGQCFACNTGDFVFLFALLLAYNTKVLERTRAIDNNLLLSSPDFSPLPALGSSVCYIRGRHVCGAYALCHLTEVQSDGVFCLC